MQNQKKICSKESREFGQQIPFSVRVNVPGESRVRVLLHCYRYFVPRGA